MQLVSMSHSDLATKTFFMEFTAARSLKDILASDPKVTVAEAVTAMVTLLEIAASFHDMERAYGGFKPSNIMVMPDGGIKVIDMSNAGKFGEQPRRHYVGASPDDATLSAAFDSYMIGRLFTRMLMGLTEGDRWYSQPRSPVPSTHDLGISPELHAILVKATGENDGDRFATAVEMLTAIRALTSPTAS